MEQREQIEKAADRLREELLLTLHELDRRREEAFSVRAVRASLSRHRREAELAMAAAVVLAGGAIALAVTRRQYRKRHAGKYRLRALERAWAHPDRIATRAPDRPMGEMLARKVLMASLATLGAQLGKRLVRDLLPAKG